MQAPPALLVAPPTVAREPQFRVDSLELTNKLIAAPKKAKQSRATRVQRLLDLGEKHGRKMRR